LAHLTLLILSLSHVAHPLEIIHLSLLDALPISFLTDHVLIERVLDLVGLGQAFLTTVVAVFLDFLADDVIAQIHALITDEDRRARDQLADFVLALATERAVQQLAVVALSGVIGHRIASEPDLTLKMQGEPAFFKPGSSGEVPR